MLLAGDIGGTKTALGIYTEENGCHLPLLTGLFASNNYKDITEIVTEFLSTTNYTITKAVFGVAGPVSKGRVKLTNLPWILEEQQLQEASEIPTVKLLNDLEAVAWSIPSLRSNDLYALNSKGVATPEGPIVILAPGTGLGEAFLIWDGCRYRAYPSEGGHSSFAPTNELELGLLRYLMRKFPHVSFERVCSGIGIPNIYTFLKESGIEEEPAWLRHKLDTVEDITPVIINSALAKEEPCAICTTTLEIFISILGSEAGNMALKLLPSGGIYLGGGIPPRILDALKCGPFLDKFFNKGIISHVLTSIPINVICKPDTALAGAASYGLEILKKQR